MSVASAKRSMTAADALALTQVRWTMTPMTLVLVSIAFLVGLVIGMIFAAAMTVVAPLAARAATAMSSWPQPFVALAVLRTSQIAASCRSGGDGRRHVSAVVVKLDVEDLAAAIAVLPGRSRA